MRVLSLAAVAYGAQGLQIIDMLTANDEIEMLRYRLRLHAPLAVKTVILESNLSHVGLPKPLYVREALTADELRRHRVELFAVPFSAALKRRMAGCRRSISDIGCTWLLEVAQRRFVMAMLPQLITRTLAENRLDDVLVHMSDLDELLDVDAVRSLALPDSGCVSPLLRGYVYGERCPATNPAWARGVLFRARSSWLARHAGPSLQLRKLYKGYDCDPSSDYLGWHFGYFMGTERIVRKLNNFAHAHDGFVAKITRGESPAAEVERRVRACLDVHGRRYGPQWAAYDGKLPATGGWPRHPAAPAALNATALVRERHAHAADLARATSARGSARAAAMARARLETTEAAIRAAGTVPHRADRAERRRRDVVRQ